MSKVIGRNQKCPCKSGKKFKLCCDGKNTKLNYWEKDKVKKTLSNTINPSNWTPKIENGRMNFNNEFENILQERYKTYDEFGGDKFKDIIVNEWIDKHSNTKSETWYDTKDEWLEGCKKTHDIWRHMIIEGDELLTMDSPINFENSTSFVNKNMDDNVEMKFLKYSLNTNKFSNYEQMLKEYDDICIDKLVLDKVNEVKSGWFKKKNSIIKFRTCDVDLNKTNIWCVLNDYCYSHLEWINKWKEELIEQVSPHLVSIYLREWYMKLGLPMNKVEMKDGVIDELIQFITKLKEVTDSKWGGIGMRNNYSFMMNRDNTPLKQFGNKKVVLQLSPYSSNEGFGSGMDRGIHTKSDNDIIKIYRNVMDLDYSKGYSWSTDTTQSLNWGKTRGYVGCESDVSYFIEGEVMKKDIMGYTNQNEVGKGGMNEVFVHPSKVKITNTTELNNDTIKEITNTNPIVRQDLVHDWLQGVNSMMIEMWENICDYNMKQDDTLILQTFLGRINNMIQQDKKNITLSIESGTIVMKPMGDNSFTNPRFYPQNKSDMKLMKDRKLFSLKNQENTMFQNTMGRMMLRG